MGWKKRTVPATTNNLTRAIVNFLLSKGHSASRVNVQGQYDPKLGKFRKSGSRNGFFDIAAVIFGRAVAFDVKTDRDELGEDQIEFSAEWTRAGGVAVEIKVYQDFLDWYEKFISDPITKQIAALLS